MHRFFVTPKVCVNSTPFCAGLSSTRSGMCCACAPGGNHPVGQYRWAYRAELMMVERDVVRAHVLERRAVETEPTVRVILYQGLLKGKSLIGCCKKGLRSESPALSRSCLPRCIVGSMEDVQPGAD